METTASIGSFPPFPPRPPTGCDTRALTAKTEPVGLVIHKVQELGLRLPLRPAPLLPATPFTHARTPKPATSATALHSEHKQLGRCVRRRNAYNIMTYNLGTHSLT
jgi:hypothetical protein